MDARCYLQNVDLVKFAIYLIDWYYIMWYYLRKNQQSFNNSEKRILLIFHIWDIIMVTYRKILIKIKIKEIFN